MARRARASGRPDFAILIATDGSAAARAAIRVAARFPWPDGVRVHAIVANAPHPELRRSVAWSLLDDSAEAVAKSTVAALKKRWPDAAVRVSDASPVEAILKEAKRVRARVIVVGWRGHGVVKRLLGGSVSRGVVRGASCAVLVVRRVRKHVQRIVVGVDGSVHAKHAVEFLAGLAAPTDGHVTVLRAIDRMGVPSQVHLTADTRAIVSSEVDRVNEARIRAARNATASAVAQLAAAGWQAEARVTAGAAVWDLLSAVSRSRADLLVVGARGASGLRRLLLGSVAEAALNRSPIPVLIVR